MGAVSLIEEWSLRKTSLAAKAFLGNEFGQGTGPLEQRAKDYCLEIGGKVRKYVDDLKATVYYDLCEFNDRSSIEIWTLYWGTQYSPKLAHILK